MMTTLRTPATTDDPVTLELRAAYATAVEDEKSAHAAVDAARRNLRRLPISATADERADAHARLDDARRDHEAAIEARQERQQAMYAHIRVRTVRKQIGV